MNVALRPLTETIRTINDGEPRTATSTFTQLLGSEKVGLVKIILTPLLLYTDSSGGFVGKQTTQTRASLGSDRYYTSWSISVLVAVLLLLRSLFSCETSPARKAEVNIYE